MAVFTAYMKYLLRSTNEHGVHSPFVFELVTQGFYDRTHRSLHAAAKSIPQFSALSSRYRKALNNGLHHLFPETTPRTGVVSGRETPGLGSEDLLCLDLTRDHNLPELSELLKNLGNDCCVLVLKKGDDAYWEALKSEPVIHLTVDCFRFGLAFKRKQQAKENFTIRL
jgi:hypothetical protein